MILYGRNPVHEALRGRRSGAVRRIWATGAGAREPWLAGTSVTVVGAHEIEQRCGSCAHQGMCADAGPYPYLDASALLERDEPLIVVLDQVQDPQNLGSICRTAECAGASGVVIGERRAVEVTAAVCKASAGAVEHLPVAKVRNTADFILQARDAGCWSYGASAPPLPGDARSQALVEKTAIVPYTAPDYRGGVLLVLGSEGKGLRPRVAAACDQLISLPLHGRVDSLGVAAAAAALLYGVLQGRGPGLDNSP